MNKHEQIPPLKAMFVSWYANEKPRDTLEASIIRDCSEIQAKVRGTAQDIDDAPTDLAFEQSIDLGLKVIFRTVLNFTGDATFASLYRETAEGMNHTVFAIVPGSDEAQKIAITDFGRPITEAVLNMQEREVRLIELRGVLRHINRTVPHNKK